MCQCMCGCGEPLGRSWRVVPMRDMRWGPVVNPYIVRVSVCERCAVEMDGLDGRAFLEVVS